MPGSSAPPPATTIPSPATSAESSGGGALERLLDGLHDAADGCFQGAPYACCVEGGAAKQAACDVSTPDESLGRAWLVEAGTDLDLHLFGALLADQQPVFAFGVRTMASSIS